jgi:hypothetical protein
MSKQAGTALLMILIAMFAIGLMSMVIAQVATTELAITANIAAGTKSFLPADGASQVLLRDLISMSRSLGRFPTDAELATIRRPRFNTVSLADFRAFTNGVETGRPISTGLYVGLSALVQPFTIIVTADSPGPPPSRATVEIDGEFSRIPIFQFGVLYEYDLDVHPGPAMVIGGRVHSNGDVYLDPGISLSLNSPITTNGDIYNFHRNGSFTGGVVQIQDSTGAYQAMAGLDSDDPNWSAEAIDRWDGRVRSGEIGGHRVDLVIENPTDPHLVIDAGRPADTASDKAAKIWYDAGLRIVNGQGFDSEGNAVSLIDPLSGTSALRNTIIYDWREEKYMLTVEVDMQKLGRTAAFPANGVVYVGAFEPIDGMPGWLGGAWGVGPPEWSGFGVPWDGSEMSEFAIKLTNGATLAAPTTIVSENPMYLQGSYNVANKKGAALVADAVTILSNDWGDMNGDGVFDNDLNYSLLDMGVRMASSTTVNAAIMTGNVDMGPAYNGGLENLPRFLERWSRVPFNFNGSLVALWRSEIANGAFGKTNVYSAPIRNWYFDTDFLDLNDLPPATPRIYQITVTSWEHH